MNHPSTFDEEQAALRASCWVYACTRDALELLGTQRRWCLGRLTEVALGADGTARATPADAGGAPLVAQSCGRFVFVREEGSAVPALEIFLGRYAALLRAVSAEAGTLQYEHRLEIAANWKHCVEITLDDYHVDRVHPTTFGPFAARPPHLFYMRDGLHSSMLVRRDGTWQFASFWDECERGAYDFTGYKIHFFFPALVMVTGRDHVYLQHIEARDGRSTTCRTSISSRAGLRLAMTDATPFWGVTCVVNQEDAWVCEHLESRGEQARRHDLLGRTERRIAWFREALAGHRAAFEILEP